MKNPIIIIKSFILEINQELKKVSWPSLKNLYESTLMVIAGTALLCLYLSIINFSLFQLINFIVSHIL